MRQERRELAWHELPPGDEPITKEGLLRAADDTLVQAGFNYALTQLRTKLFLDKIRICFDSLHERWDGTPSTFMRDLKHVVNKYISEYTDISYQRQRRTSLTPEDIERLRRSYFQTILHMCRIVAAQTAKDRAELRQPSLQLAAAE